MDEARDVVVLRAAGFLAAVVPPLALRVVDVVLVFLAAVLRERVVLDAAPLVVVFFAAALVLRERVPLEAVAPDDFFALVLRVRVVPLLDAAAAGLRSFAGTSSRTTCLANCGISFCRNVAIRSSWRRNSLASLAVSRSYRALASSSIAR